MKVYKFKCDSCGSKQYIKTKHGYKCKYCGSFQDVITDESHDVKEEPEAPSLAAPTNVEEEMIEEKHVGLKMALILFFSCYFLGMFGVHKFIERKIGLGVVYLCTGGLFGIGWLVDMIRHGITMGVELRAFSAMRGKE